MPLIPTFSPQGDGNVAFGLNVQRVVFNSEVDPYLFPARGRKHYLGSVLLTLSNLLLGLIPTFSPQGDGNGSVVLDASTSGLYNVDPYLFPARGRKLNLQRF